MNIECKNPYRLNFTTIWDELNEIKKRLRKLESKSKTYDMLLEIRTLGELDNLIALIRKELEKYGIVSVSVEKHDE